MTERNPAISPPIDAVMPPELPSVSVILITKGRHDQAEKAIRSVLSGEYPPAKRECIVVEETGRALPLSVDGVLYIPIPLENRGYAYARTIGLSHASYDLCAFIDDDCIADTMWLKELVKGMIDHLRAGAIGGAVKVPVCGPVGQCENILGFPGGGVKYLHESHGTVIERPTFSTCNCIIGKQVLRDAGGFDERLRLGGEDEMLSRKIGVAHGVLYSPRAIVYHAPRDDLSRVFLWFVRRGKAKSTAMQFYPMPLKETVALFTNSPLLRIAMAIALIVIIRIPLLPALILLGGVYYTVMLRRYRWSLSYFPALKTFLYLPLVKMVMDIGFDTGLFVTWLNRYKKTFFCGNRRVNE
jgi:glycosyltransferase involved in cell wall biosynthesis